MDNDIPEVDFKRVAELLANELASAIGRTTAEEKYKYFQMQVLADTLMAQRNEARAQIQSQTEEDSSADETDER